MKIRRYKSLFTGLFGRFRYADIDVYLLVVPTDLDGDGALLRIELSLDYSNGVATVSRRL